MATFYTDVAQNQRIGLNFPGSGSTTEGITTQPGTQNNPLLEGPPEIIATYILTGTEVANDVINIAIARSGWIISPNGKVATGAIGPGGTLTVAVGDNDLALFSGRPIVNPGPQSVNSGVSAAAGVTSSTEAPTWITGIAYAVGNVTLDPGDTPTYRAYICTAAVSGSTQPHSDSSHWLPFSGKYSTSIAVGAASGNVAFATGMQLYGPPGYSAVIGTAGTPAATPWVIQGDCWLQALVLSVVNLNANAILTFRIPVLANN